MYEPEYYDVDGNPIDLMTWAHLMEIKEYRIVRHTKVGGHIISTVWLGLNSNFWGGPPLIFETMIFGEDEFDGYQERYSTVDEAVRGHEQAVQMVKVLEELK